MVKAILKKSFNTLGGDFLLREKNRTPRILFWHGVAEDPHPIIEAESISKKDFLKQIDYLEKNFQIISIEEFDKRYASQTLGGKEVVLTFDDGYQNNLTVLAPILRKRNLPFIVFISTENITNGSIFPTSILRLITFGSDLEEVAIPSLGKSYSLLTSKDKFATASYLSNLIKNSRLDFVNTLCKELIGNLTSSEWESLIHKYPSVVPMSWDEVKQLKTYGGSVGSHCLDHICCHSNQDEEVVKNQIQESKEIIERELQTSCDYFAFPNGNYTEFAKTCLKESGYKLGFSTEKKKLSFQDNENFSVPRISIPFNIDTFKIMVNLHPKA